MTPLRIIILAILIFILYRLIIGPKKKRSPFSRSKGEDVETTRRDILVEDPVCHSYVPKKEAIRGYKGGETFYFCSEGCAQTFLEDTKDDSSHSPPGDDQ